MKANPLQARARRIVRALARLYPDARCSLDYASPLQLLVATILAAQCTDVRINQVTPALFARYPDAASFANANPEELEALIQSTGFFRNKARNLIACCRQLAERHGGRVPATMEELVPLAGVGRKTANVVLGNAFGVPGIPVDTHVGRLSQRLGLTRHTDPVHIERDLMAVLPRQEWTAFAHRMIYHGRQVCHARKPLCDGCALAKLCPQTGVGKAAPQGPAEAEEVPRQLRAGPRSTSEGGGGRRKGAPRRRGA
jgi:endonuclease-3